MAHTPPDCDRRIRKSFRAPQVDQYWQLDDLVTVATEKKFEVVDADKNFIGALSPCRHGRQAIATYKTTVSGGVDSAEKTPGAASLHRNLRWLFAFAMTSDPFFMSNAPVGLPFCAVLWGG
jgi:hypothetical protein